ncbi:LysM peptidoglycan-binding domain-containing protein [Dyella koreensis]|uniref:LysM domain-containing protein n=1 Tax=Dyella koreensis TaxID=311235 RepID=A0ABW8K343_9GAMM
MGIESILKNDPVIQLLGGGGSHGVQGNGHVLLNFAMSPGDTINTIAEKLGLPIDGLLQSNPGLRADTPLTAGLTVQLPMSNLGDIRSALGGDNGHAYGRDNNNGANGTSSQRELPLPPDLADAIRGNDRVDGLRLGLSLSLGANAQSVPLMAAGLLNTTDTALMAGREQPLAGSVWPGATAGPGTAPVSYVPSADRGSVVATGLPSSSLATARADGVMLSFAQVAGAMAQAAMDRQHNSQSVPPPPPMPWLDGTRPNLLATPMASPVAFAQVAPSVNWSVAAAPVVDGNEAKLQIMAFLAAQLGQASSGTATAANVQAPGFIDPQAVAAHAASMRAGRSINLGAGRSLEFTLVNDRMRRVGAIGDEERTLGGRRAGKSEVNSARGKRAEAEEEAQRGQDSDEGRRRRAAVAAMRRRRRKLSVRCRPRKGARRPLREPGNGRYPGAVDWAEFRGRLPPRYLWGDSSSEA